MRLKTLLSQPLVAKLGGLGLSAVVRQWMGTLEFKTAYYDPTVDPAYYDLSSRRFIYIFWHEYIPYQLYLRGNCDICMLLSLNRDAHLLHRAAHHMGFSTVRGSTHRGSLRALRELMRAGKSVHLTVTPDGPRGPRRRLASGPVYVASRLGLPIIALGMGYDRPWRLSSWDRFALPRPYSRARCIVSPPIHIPPGIESDDVAIYGRSIERLLTRLTIEAETWAETGTRRAGQRRTRRQPRRLAARFDGRHDEPRPLALPHSRVVRRPFSTPIDSLQV